MKKQEIIKKIEGYRDALQEQKERFVVYFVDDYLSREILRYEMDLICEELDHLNGFIFNFHKNEFRNVPKGIIKLINDLESINDRSIKKNNNQILNKIIENLRSIIDIYEPYGIIFKDSNDHLTDERLIHREE